MSDLKKPIPTHFRQFYHSGPSSLLNSQIIELDEPCDKSIIEEPLLIDQSYGNTREVKFARQHKHTEKLNSSPIHTDIADGRRRISSLNICNSCVKYVQKIDELTAQQKILSERCSATEKHLKQYDNLLQVKDNRLKQQEASVRAELDQVEREKEKLCKERQRIYEEKKEFEQERNRIALENEKIEQGIEEIHRKSDEIQMLFEELEQRNELLAIREETHARLEEEYSEKLFSRREDDIQRLLGEAQLYQPDPLSLLNKDSGDLQTLQDYIAKQKQKIKFRKQELMTTAKELNELKENLEKVEEKNAREFEIRMNLLTEAEEKLVEERININETQERINEELESIEELKDILKQQQENLEKERELMKESFESKMARAQKLKKMPSLSIITGDYREKFSEAETRFSLNDVGEISFGKLLTESPENHREYESLYFSVKKELELCENKLKIVEYSRCELESLNEKLAKKIDSLKEKKRILKSNGMSVEKILQSDDSALNRQIENVETKYTELVMHHQGLEDNFNSLNKKFIAANRQKEDLEAINQDLSKDLAKCKELSKSLQEKLEIYENSTSDSDYYTIKIKQLSEELENKLGQVMKKEEELLDLQKYLLSEKKSIDTAAEIVRSINEDLNNEKQKHYEEKDLFEKQKVRLMGVDINLQEKAKMLISKESELLIFKENLTEREKLLCMQEKKILTPDLRGLDTSLFD